jgi:anti-sigma regulatory factor (Ser/Thr protein kinase)
VPGGPHAAARARRLVEGELAGRMAPGQLADVLLLVTELVANGVRHGGATEDLSVHVLLQGTGPGLLVEVMNPDHAIGAVALRAPDLSGGGGIGLHLVDRLSSRWGVRESAQTTVWFELDC